MLVTEIVAPLVTHVVDGCKSDSLRGQILILKPFLSVHPWWCKILDGGRLGTITIAGRSWLETVMSTPIWMTFQGLDRKKSAHCVWQSHDHWTIAGMHPVSLQAHPNVPIGLSSMHGPGPSLVINLNDEHSEDIIKFLSSSATAWLFFIPGLSRLERLLFHTNNSSSSSWAESGGIRDKLAPPKLSDMAYTKWVFALVCRVIGKALDSRLTNRYMQIEHQPIMTATGILT